MIRQLLLGGASALAFATPLFAQASAPPAAATAPSSGLDTLVPADAVTAAPAAKTGDAVLDRLNELEAKINALEARNKELETQATETATRVQKVEVRAAKGVQPGVAPTFADVTDSFSFHPRGTFQIDYAAYHERAGGYDYNNGTDIRRARFGFDGTAFRVFKYRIEAEYVKGAVNLLDAYIQYTGIPKLTFTIGQQKAPYGLEANSTDALNTFLERGMANNAFGAVGAERRVGATVAYTPIPQVIATVGIFGAGEAVQRNAATPGEVYGVNGRVTWEPINDTGRLIHLGTSAYHVSNLAGKAITLSDRPNTRVDGGNIESVALGPITTGPIGGQTRGVRSATFIGGEVAGVYGPFSVQGEYDHLHVDRYGFVPDLNFSGFYGFATFFITGESRSFKGGVVDRVKPFSDFDYGHGHWGAFELAVRYDQLNLTDLDLSTTPHKAQTYTAGINWYLNSNLRYYFNFIRFKGTNSPLAIAPATLNGTTGKGDAYAMRMQFDF